MRKKDHILLYFKGIDNETLTEMLSLSYYSSYVLKDFMKLILDMLVKN